VGDADIVGDLHGRLIAFDLDGTLVDSRRDLADAANELIAELGGTPLAEEAIGLMVGEGARVLVMRALRAAGLDGAAQAAPLARNLARFLEIYDARLLRHTRPYPGIEAVLTAAQPHARLAVLTNKPARATAAVLEGLGLRSFFEDVVGGDGEWPRKPDPAGLRYLMAQAQATPARTLLVGDSAIDHETAARAGVRCCLATYGFGYLSFPAERLSGNEWLVREPAELVPLFDSIVREP
jgi:phosphoglycolate phosphatase